MRKFPVEKMPHWLQSLLRPDVLKIMQIKFVAMAMGILIGVFIVMLTAINMIMKTVSQSQSMDLLIKIAQSDRYDSLNEEPPPNGEFPPPEGEIPPDNMPPPTEPETIAQAEVPGFRPLGWIPEDDRGQWGERFDDRRRRDDRMSETNDDDDDDNDVENNNEPRWNPEQPPPWEQQETRQWESEYLQPPPEPVLPAETQPVPEITEPPAQPVQIPEEIQPPELPPEETPPAMPAEPPEEPHPEETPVPETETTASETQTSETLTETTPETTPETTISVSESETKESRPKKPEEDNQNGNQHNNGEFRMEMRPNKWDVKVILNHFALMADADGNFLGIRNTENYTEEEAKEILAAILSTEKQHGMYGWLQYYKAEKNYGTLLVVTDKSSDQGLLNNLFRTTVIAGIIVLLILFVFLIFFSRWIIKPVRIAMERQKQFVSDASHELKTPIAVLTANVDILQDEIGENKWLGYIQEQTGRMNQLVGDLLRLARMDNAKQEYVFEEFNLSTAIEATALPFESQAFEKQKNLEIDIQPDVTYTGSEQHIRQLAAIFIDNAMKYSNEHGTIKISLMRRGDNRILEFYNTGCEISQEETDKIFQRFYRGDKARNNKGKNGYGLGLAIAKSIMEIHKIKIQVTCEQGAWIRFLMIL